MVIILTASNFALSSASANEISLGNPQAPVTIIEYGSLTCSNCIQFHTQVYPQVRKHYIDTGKVRFIYRHFPTSGSAVEAARAADCAGDNYYQMVDALFDAVADWSKAENRDAIFKQQAASFGLDAERFQACINDNKLLDEILSQHKAAKKDLDVTGTPTFFINGSIVRGKRGFAEMEVLITEALNQGR
jgi:protein-disulfide isomerase